MDNRVDLLLQEIKQAALCLYISDLPSATFSDRAKERIAEISDEEYTVEEWKEAIAYINGTKNIVHSVSEAKRVLQEKR